MLCLKKLCPVNTEITRISVALDLPEFQWNQLEPRVYIDFSEVFPRQTELFHLIHRDVQTCSFICKFLAIQAKITFLPHFSAFFLTVPLREFVALFCSTTKPNKLNKPP